MPTVSRLLQVARAQLGYVERGGADGKSGNITKYGKAFGWDGVAWCSTFLWWVFTKVGIDLETLFTRSWAGCQAAVAAARRKHCFHPRTRGIRAGDIAYFQWGDGVADHTGIVERVDRHGIHTIEGNTTPGASVSDPNGGGVYRRLRPSWQFLGYTRVPGLRYDLRARARHHARRLRRKRYPLLTVGSHGKAVARLQRLLNKAGVRVGGKQLYVDGDYGPKTRRAVVGYQTAHHLRPDGEAGPKTLATIHF